MLRRSLATVNICQNHVRRTASLQGCDPCEHIRAHLLVYSSDRASLSSLPSYIFTSRTMCEFVLSLKVTMTLPFRYDVLCDMGGWGARSDSLL